MLRTGARAAASRIAMKAAAGGEVAALGLELRGRAAGPAAAEEEHDGGPAGARARGGLEDVDVEGDSAGVLVDLGARIGEARGVGGRGGGERRGEREGEEQVGQRVHQGVPGAEGFSIR
jgi:hypothetical protein